MHSSCSFNESPPPAPHSSRRACGSGGDSAKPLVCAAQRWGIQCSERFRVRGEGPGGEGALCTMVGRRLVHVWRVTWPVASERSTYMAYMAFHLAVSLGLILFLRKYIFKGIYGKEINTCRRMFIRHYLYWLTIRNYLSVQWRNE